MKSVIGRDEIKEVEKKFVIEDESLFYKGRKPKNTREAFVISLAKWTILLRETKKGNDVNDGNVYTCGLCMKFLDEENGYDEICSRCPIFKETGKQQCRGTSYYRFRDSYEMEERLLAAKEELKFLTDLANKTLKS